MNYEKKEYSEKKYEVVVKEITPQMAREMLKRNPFNRQIKEQNVSHLAFQMKKGLWKDNVSQPIAFDKDGNLLDGQHRLTAIIKADMPIRMAIIYGANKEDFYVIDTGRPRGIADVLYMQGVKSYTSVAGTIRALWQLKKQTADTHNIVLGLTSEIAYEEYMKDPDLFQKAMRLGARLHASSHLLAISEIGGICLYLVKERHHTFEEVERFFIELTSGGSFNAMTQLRQMIIRSNNAPIYKQKMTATVRRTLIAKVWNAFISGVDVKRLTYNPEQVVQWL